MSTVVVFDLDGTLLDTDEALAAAFVALGVPRDEITFGHVLADECARFGLRVEDYLAAYDAGRSMPFAGVEELLSAVGRWAVCSNKHPESGHEELARLGWTPEVACFADTFRGPKSLAPVLERLGVGADEIVFVGDTSHDQACAAAAGARFVWAGWNPRTRPDGGEVALVPADVVRFLR